MNIMKKNSKVRQIMMRILAVVMVMACVFTAPTVEAAGKWTGVADGDILIKDTITPIAAGVTEHEVITNTAKMNDQKIDYLCEIVPGDNIKLAAGYGKDNANSWSLTPTTVQAAAYEKNHPGQTVVAAINADFFNMATGEPMGALVMEGEVKHEANGRYYFGVTKDGKAVIRNSADLSDLEMAVGGDALLINDGVAISDNTEYGDLNYSRTAIGIKADGTVITFVTYGNRAPISCGRTYVEIAQMLERQGCVWALALDGGGSATYAGRPEGTTKLEVRNSPNDGAERAVSSAVLIVSTAEATGVFSHAQLAPNNQLYTPGSEVQFTASGVDTAGIAMDLPEDVTYALAEDSKSLGEIDAATGLFTAGKDTGVVTVNLLQGEKVIGSTTIEIVVPDHIYFASEEISLGFEEQTDFGIVVRNQGRDINYKVGDFVWSITDGKMGTFEGNTFTSSDGESLTGTVTATSAWDNEVHGSITVIVGKLPTVVWDFEDVTTADGTVIEAEKYYVDGYTTTTKDETTGEDVENTVPGILTTSNYGRGAQQSVEVVSIDDDEPVFFGEKSLKLNYDFTQCGEVTEGACIGTSEGMDVPGTPTGIGVWVYAPEGVGIEWKGDGTQAGFWLRGYVRNGAGVNTPYDFTLEPKHVDVQNGEKQPGIYWEGWHYLEADLTGIQAPYGIQPAMTFRLMYVFGTQMGTKSAGSIYFDNLQFVYGTNVDDVDAPVVDSITVNGAELKDGAVLNTDKVNVDAIISDVQNKYTTGIDESTVRMYIDGVNVVGNDKYEYAYADQIAHVYNVKLADGVHSVTVSMKDGFGNETTETRFFTVETGAAAETKVEVVCENAILGGNAEIQIKASDATVANSVTSIKLGNQFKEYDVKFSDNYEGTVSYSNLSKNITITANRKADAAAEDGNVIATLSAKIPANALEGDKFSYTVKAGSFVNANGYYGSYSSDEVKLPIVAGYNLYADPIVIGGASGQIKVTDAEGNKVGAGISVYLASDNSLVGTTDENGIVATENFNAAAGEYAVYAKDEEGALSFHYKVKAYNPRGEENGLPDVIRFNAVEDPTTMKNITWLTNPLNEGAQSLQYAVSGSDNWKNAEVVTEQCEFQYNGFNASNINGALIKGLSPATTYDYKVGTGDAIVTGKFSTEVADRAESKFFVIPDIQDPDKANLQTIIDRLNDEEWNFAVQIGDAIDQANDYDDWAALGEILGAEMLGDTDLLTVMGNHEYYGDAKAKISSAMYNNPVTDEGTYYSVENGNIYMAVINFATTKAQIKEATEWLVKDAAKSDAIWKVLVTHQPPYYTNTAGGNEIVYELLPDAAEEAGIDVVFSGHDHAVGRTNLLKDDKIDEENGVLYYVTGAAGSKRYSVASDNVFDFATIFGMTPTADYEATYLTVSSDKDEMKIDVYDVNQGLLDTFTIKSKCAKHGHEDLFDPEKDEVKCEVCKEVTEDFTGDIFDAEENEYYLVNGVKQTGWKTVGEEVRFYDAKGIREEVTKDETPTTCIVRGFCIHTSASGEVFTEKYEKAGGHEYEEKDGAFVCANCGHTRVNMEETKVTLGYTKTTYSGAKKSPATTAVAPDGTVLSNEGEYRDYYRNYYNNVEVGTASVKLTAEKYGLYVNITDWRGNCKGSITVYYDILPKSVKSAYTVVDGTTATVKWNAVDNVDKYVVYQSVNGGEWTELGTTTETSYDVNDISADKAYAFRVGTRKAGTDENGVVKDYESMNYAEANVLVPAVNATCREKDGKPVLTWNAIEGAEYKVSRATSEDGTFKKIFTTTKTSFTNTSVEAGQTYYYKVTATLGKDSGTSAVCKVTAACARPVVKADNSTAGKPSLTWNAVTGAAKYEVYRSTTGEDGKFSRIYTTTKTTFTNTSAENGKTYYYKVCALTEDGTKSALSAAVGKECVTTKPSLTKANRAIDGAPRLTWDAVDGAAKYEVYRSTTGEVNSYKRVYTTTKTTFTNTSVETGNAYYYKVRIITSNGAKGPFSSRVKVKALEVSPVVTVTGRKSDGKPVLTWEKVKGAAKYEVYRSTTGEDGSFKKCFTTEKLKYTNTSAKAGKTYYYKVKPVSASGISGHYSKVVKKTVK